MNIPAKCMDGTSRGGRRQMTVPKQSAELRVVYKRGGRHALVATVTVRGFDVYFGLPGGPEGMLTSSYHETGRTYTKVAGGRKRLIDKPIAPVQDFRGVKRAWETAPDPDSLNWDYRLRAEKGTRRNLTVDLDTLDSPVPPTVAIWMIERGGVTQLTDVMQAYRSSQLQEFVDYKIIDWTQPWLLVVVHKPTAVVLESLREQIPRLGLPEGGRIGGFVSGPGPPTGKMVKVWPEPEETTEIPTPEE
jgi:hypothetical protein